MSGFLFPDLDEPAAPTRGAYGARSDVTAPFSRPGTSQAAAVAIVPHLGRLQAQILGFLRERGERGATAEEVEDGAGIAGNTARPRILELKAKSLVQESGEERRTRSGRRAVVYVATIGGQP